MTKHQHGGRREGAGRKKKIGFSRVQVTLSDEVIAWVDTYAPGSNRSEKINHLLAYHVPSQGVKKTKKKVLKKA